MRRSFCDAKTLMNVKKRLGELFKRWPVVFVAASAVLTVVWIGALTWLLVALLVGLSGI